MTNTPMNPNKALWEKGDFTRIAETCAKVAKRSYDGSALPKDSRFWISDVAMARPPYQRRTRGGGARRGHRAEPGRGGEKRAAEHGLTNCTFQEGDATNLQQLPDQSFDLVMSIFGAMFAPKPFDVAKEMVRVTRPGGRIVMGNWIPERPDASGADSQDQLELHAATARRVRQPNDVGHREPRDRAVHRCRGSGREDLLRARHVHLQLPRRPVSVRG